jgi:hypothetical protein
LCGGATSFDLIDPQSTVVLPSKRGEWFIRQPGRDPIRTNNLPDGEFKGFGPGIQPAVYPLAKHFAELIATIKTVRPELLAPEYMIEPSISQPRTPFRDAKI